MSTKAEICFKMNALVEKFYSLPHCEFENAIKLHYKSIFKSYNENKLFFKTIFKSHRFLLATLIVNEYYASEEPLLANVKKNFLDMNMLSGNTISTFFAFLKITRRIELKTSQHDKRKWVYRITEKGINETYQLINTMTVSLSTLFPGHNIKELTKKDDFLPHFFRHYKSIVDHQLFYFDMVENVDIFILKDAGHMILLNLYCNAYKHEDCLIVSIPLAKLASNCGVSRSHIKRIILEAEEKKLLTYCNQTNTIRLLPEFIHMFEKYMAYYFASVLIGFNIEA